MNKHTFGYVIDDSMMLIADFEHKTGTSLSRKNDGWYLTPRTIIRSSGIHGKGESDESENGKTSGPYLDMEDAIVRRFSPKATVVRLTTFQFQMIVGFIRGITKSDKPVVLPTDLEMQIPLETDDPLKPSKGKGSRSFFKK